MKGLVAVTGGSGFIGREVVLATPGSLTFTTSGKLSRAAAKAHYLDGSITDVAATRDQRADERAMAVYAVAS